MRKLREAKIVFGRNKPSGGSQGGSVGDEYLTVEIHNSKAERLAEWLNYVHANGYDLEALEGYGGGGSVYLMAVARRRRR